MDEVEGGDEEGDKDEEGEKDKEGDKEEESASDLLVIADSGLGKMPALERKIRAAFVTTFVRRSARAVKRSLSCC